MQLAFIKCHGSGNDFPLIDARGLALSDGEWAGVARALADRDGPVGGDGLLALTAGDESHAFGMRMWNSDGSEAETCLNGLRCVARLGFELLGTDAARVKLKTSSAEVAREAELAPGVVTVRTVVGPAGHDIGLTGPLSDLPSDRAFVAVAMPNPHLVTFVDAIDEAELVALGTWCEGGPALIPGRANVSFVELRGSDLFVRTFERGVGLTDSCGSAMAASVLAAALSGRIVFGAETIVFNKGGMVRGTASRDGIVTISGNATFLYDAAIEVDPASGTAGSPLVHARREDEVAAWSAVLVGLA
ncbi:diaminopimelate epimerase [Sphingomonas sp. LB-2]|uniref:diaminopimelate epimerase n=1 Tax=Sphingomonas caeni TaxID=2984949 RepID=UPI00223143B4|nr:diaminopimelate epimerase [Sphingomonas caeni]MCW3846443.1 diaminopimelate epimerase [Sphingomonas caeni]